MGITCEAGRCSWPGGRERSHGGVAAVDRASGGGDGRMGSDQVGWKEGVGTLAERTPGGGLRR